MLVTNPPQTTARTTSFSIYGFPFRLRTNAPEIQGLIAGLYANFLAPQHEFPIAEAVIEAEGDDRYAWRFGDKGDTGSTLPRALWNLEAALCESIIRSQKRLIAVHAAAIRIENSAALLAGCSHAGKTTLSLALVQRGLQVAGDDVALVDPDSLNVFPIPRCFHADDRGAALLEADGLRLPAAWPRYRFITPNDFAVPAQPPGRARWLLFLQGPRADHPRIAPITQAEMTARLLGETGKGPLEDSETIKAICGVAAGASCFALTPGPLGETADAVAALLAGPNRS